MLEGGGGDQKIKRPSSEFLALLSEGFPNMGAPPSNRRRDGEDRNGLDERLEFPSCFLRGGTAQDSLINLGVGNDADGDAALREPGKQSVCLVVAGQMINDPVAIDQIPHGLGRAAPLLLPGFVDIREQLPGIHARECSSAFLEPRPHPFRIINRPDIFLIGCRYVVEYAVLLQEKWRLVGFLEEASKFASWFYFDTFGLKIHKKNHLRQRFSADRIIARSGLYSPLR